MQSLFSSLFDLSFKRYATPQLAPYIFVLAIIVVGLNSLFLLRLPFGFLVAPITFLASIVFIRAAIEFALSVFQIARYTAEIARRGRGPEAEVQEDL